MEASRSGARLAGLLLLLLTLAPCPVVRAVEWPTFAGGPRRLFFNPDETQVTAANVANLRIKWQFPVGAALTASPTVATIDLPGEGPTQVVFASSWDKTAYAVRLFDGSEVWRFAVPDYPGGNYPNAASVAVAEVNGAPRAYFASEQYMYALDARTGEELWRFAAGTGCLSPPGLCGFDGERNEIESSPLVADGLVVFGMDVNDRPGGKGGIYGIDAIDGRLVWFFDGESGMTCRPDPGDDIRRYDGYHSEEELGLPSGFFTTRTGCDHPRTPNGCNLIWSSAAYDDGRHRLFIVSGNCDTDDDPATLRPFPPMPPFDEAIFALSIDGSPAWRWRPREVDTRDLDFGAVPNLFTIDVDGTPRDVVGVGGKDGIYYVIDRDGVNASNGARWDDDPPPPDLPYWATDVEHSGPAGGIIATAAVDEGSGRIYFATAPGSDPFVPQRPTVHALDLETGAVLWQNTAETDADASFAPTSAIPGVVFVGGASTGSLRFYDAASGAKLGSVPTGIPVNACGPAIVDGHVLTGGGVGEQSDNHSNPADIVSRIPQKLRAFCVPGTPACDHDQDGVDFPEDCDDRDARRSPEAREMPDNDVDEDCDGLLATSDEVCLQGGSAHQDRRDLDAVRAGMEATCPCAEFDGSRKHKAKNYRGCVRGTIRAALKAGTLRRVCKGLLRQSTCGQPTRAVCCEEKLKTGRRSCRARKTCTDGKRVTRVIEEGATSCAETDCTLDLPTTTSTSMTTTTSTSTTSTTSTSSTTLPASWAGIYGAVLDPACRTCHSSADPAGGLGGFEDCALAHAALVGVASTQLPTLNRVEPGDPAASWLVYKLDGTQSARDAECVEMNCGAAMPVNQAQLDAAERDAIRAWIMNGAANDCPTTTTTSTTTSTSTSTTSATSTSSTTLPAS